MKGPASRTQTDKRFQSYRNEHRRIQDILPLFPGRMRQDAVRQSGLGVRPGTARVLRAGQMVLFRPYPRVRFLLSEVRPGRGDRRDRYEGIEPGYHMNKRHWINVRFDRDVPDSEIRRLVRRSYELVAGRSDRKR